MQKGTIEDCLRETMHNCGIDKILMMPFIEGMGHDLSAHWQSRFKLVQSNIRHALQHFERVASGISSKNTPVEKELVAYARLLHEKFAFIIEKAPKKDRIVPPPIHLYGLYGEVAVAYERLAFFTKLAQLADCKSILKSLEEKTVGYGRPEGY